VSGACRQVSERPETSFADHLICDVVNKGERATGLAGVKHNWVERDGEVSLLKVSMAVVDVEKILGKSSLAGRQYGLQHSFDRGTQFGPRIEEPRAKRTRMFGADHWNEGVVVKDDKIRPAPVNDDGKLRSHTKTYCRSQRLRPIT
jgi:hypothetical protein